MGEDIGIALISLFGTFAGTIGGILTSNKLTGYRIERLEVHLEEQMKKLNEINEKTFNLEKSSELQEEKIKVANHRIDDLERKTEREAS